jgi:hypothetical protein
MFADNVWRLIRINDWSSLELPSLRHVRKSPKVAFDALAKKIRDNAEHVEKSPMPRQVPRTCVSTRTGTP